MLRRGQRGNHGRFTLHGASAFTRLLQRSGIQLPRLRQGRPFLGRCAAQLGQHGVDPGQDALAQASVCLHQGGNGFIVREQSGLHILCHHFVHDLCRVLQEDPFLLVPLGDLLEPLVQLRLIHAVQNDPRQLVIALCLLDAVGQLVGKDLHDRVSSVGVQVQDTGVRVISAVLPGLSPEETHFPVQLPGQVSHPPDGLLLSSRQDPRPFQLGLCLGRSLLPVCLLRRGQTLSHAQAFSQGRRWRAVRRDG